MAVELSVYVGEALAEYGCGWDVECGCIASAVGCGEVVAGYAGLCVL